MFRAAPRCSPKACQGRRVVPALAIPGPIRATPYGALWGRNPTGRWLFFRNPALQHAHVARLHDAHRALACKKMTAGAASGEASARPGRATRSDSRSSAKPHVGSVSWVRLAQRNPIGRGRSCRLTACGLSRPTGFGGLRSLGCGFLARASSKLGLSRSIAALLRLGCIGSALSADDLACIRSRNGAKTRYAAGRYTCIFMICL